MVFGLAELFITLVIILPFGVSKFFDKYDNIYKVTVIFCCGKLQNILKWQFYWNPSASIKRELAN